MKRNIGLVVCCVSMVVVLAGSVWATSPYELPYGVQWNFMVGGTGDDGGSSITTTLDVSGDGTVFVLNRTSGNSTWGSGAIGSINSGLGAITPLGKLLYGTTLRSMPGLTSPGQNYVGGVSAAGNRAYICVYDGGQYWTGEDGNDGTRAHVYSLDSSGLSSIADRHTLSVYANSGGTPRTDALKPITTGLTPASGQNRIVTSDLRDSTLDLVLVMDMVNGDFATAGDYEGYGLRSSGTGNAYLPGIGVYNFASNTLSGPAKQPILTCSVTNTTWSNMGAYYAAAIDQVTGHYYGGGLSHTRGESTSDGWDPDGSGPAASIPISGPSAIGTAYDSSNNLLYSVTWDTAGYDIIYDITASDDGTGDAFWAGEKLDDCYIEKRDASGAILWSESFDQSPGGGVERVRNVNVQADGDLLVTGYFGNGATYDTFVRMYRKTDTNTYALQWITTNGLAGITDYLGTSALDPSDKKLYLLFRTDGQWPNTTGHVYRNRDLLVQKLSPGDFDDGTGTGTPDGLVNFDDVHYVGTETTPGIADLDTYDFDGNSDSTIEDAYYLVSNIMDRMVGDIHPGEVSERHSDVDNADIGKAIGSYTGGGGSGKVYLDGDMDFDGDVDNDDIAYMLNTYSAAMTPNGTWPLVGKPVTNGTGADLVYNPDDGHVWLSSWKAPGGRITSFQLENIQGTFATNSYVGPSAGSYGEDVENVTSNVLADTDLMLAGFWGVHDMGTVFPAGMGADELMAYLTTAVYTGNPGSGQEVFNLVLGDVPARPGFLLLVR